MSFEIVEVARRQIGQSKYKLGVRTEQAPNIVDCSSFMVWIHTQVGIYLPRYARDQFELCSMYVSTHDAQAGDLLFTNSKHRRFKTCPVLDIGHVGIVSGTRTVIHACHRHGGVVEEIFDEFFRGDCNVAVCGRFSVSEGRKS